MKIRAATSDDLAAIATIQAASPEASQWSPASYLDYDCLVAIEHDQVAGFLVSRQTAPGEREILNVAVALSERRRGVARRLIAAEFEHARGRWFLEVRESNIAALNLYKACGFQEAGRRNSYYHDPTESGIVMKLNS
jgi:[ribosomal protein S18]-alanine N-acetyltransferase